MGGQFLLVSQDFLRRVDATQVLGTLLLYLLTWNDWSETRWCVVKYASRRMIRSVVCGVDRLVRLVKADPDVAGSYINGCERFTPECRFYLCLAACSSAPAEAVHLKLLKDDRFLRFGEELRRDMADMSVRVCNYPHLLWRRLHAVAGGDGHGYWHHFRSECIRSVVIGAGYLQKGAFNMFGVLPWMYTQGDILDHVERIRSTLVTELAEDETMRKIAVGLANGVSLVVFVQALELRRDASMATNMNERAHGCRARLCDDHTRYGYELVAGRSTVNSCSPLFEVSRI